MLSNHYKLLPADIRNIQVLDDVINCAQLDPRYISVHFSRFSSTESLKLYLC